MGSNLPSFMSNHSLILNSQYDYLAIMLPVQLINNKEISSTRLLLPRSKIYVQRGPPEQTESKHKPTQIFSSLNKKVQK